VRTLFLYYMSAPEDIDVPIDILLSDQLTASEKVVWMALKMDRLLKNKLLLSPTRLKRRLGISRPTVRQARAKLIEEGWFIPRGAKTPKYLRPELGSATVTMPTDLIFSTDVAAQAKVVYGVLQNLKGYDEDTKIGKTAYAILADKIGLSAKTVRRAVLHLAKLRWLTVTQEHKRAPVEYRHRNPVEERQELEISCAEQIIDSADHVGESLMDILLSTMVDEEEFSENGYHGIMKNKKTGRHLQFDRYYYYQKVAFEFQGEQHDYPTELFDEEAVAAQQERDALKREICKEHNITLIELRGDELSWRTILNKITKLLPLKMGTDCNRRLLKKMEKRCKGYERRVKQARARRGGQSPSKDKD
jgi:hypothetical protein